jgi:hypothetical protein
MQLMNGFDDRSNAWLFTCSRWSENDVYIVLPINPAEFDVDNPLRSAMGETQRGKFMYIHRNPLGKSVIVPCNYTFTIPSGLIIPQFSDTYINEARTLAFQFASQMRGLYDQGQTWTKNFANAGDTSPDSIDSSAQAKQRQQNIATQVSKYRATVDNKYNAHIPGPTQVRDYTTQASATTSPFNDTPARPNIYGQIGTGGVVDPYNNIPDLYHPNVPIGIQNFYAFIMLMEEPRVYQSAVTGKLENNRIIVHINSTELPAMTFWGWQDQGGINFSEDSEDPGQFNITFSVFVTGSDPGLGYTGFDGLMNRYKAEIASQSTSLERLRSVIASNPAKPL